MKTKTAAALFNLASLLPVGQPAAHAQAFTSPLEFTFVPISLEWYSSFAEDFEATTAASRMRLKGPVKSVTTHYVLAPNTDPNHDYYPHCIRIAHRFDAHGNLECSQFNDSRSGDHRESMYLTEYEPLKQPLLASRITATSFFLMGGDLQPELTFAEEVARFTYDANARILTATNTHSRRFREAHFDRSPTGTLLRIRYAQEQHENLDFAFDPQGRLLLVPSRAAPEDTLDATWTARDQFDWIYDGQPGGRRGWMSFDRHGTLTDWEFPGIGNWVRFHQTVIYDEHGNWTSLMVDFSSTKTDGTRVVGMPAWGYTRQIEYTPSPASPPARNSSQINP